MASEKKLLAVEIRPRALRDLDLIWAYNAEKYSPEHANRYDQFLLGHIERLGQSLNPGRQLPGNERRRYETFRYKSKAHGHIAIFTIFEDTLVVHRIFHTAQDWTAKAYDIPPDDGYSDAAHEIED